MKCLLHISVISGGGAERVLCQLANHLVTTGEVIMLVSHRSENEYELDGRVNKYYLDELENGATLVKQVKNIRKFIKNEKPDIAISFLPEANFRLLIANWGLKTKTLISIRNDPQKEYASNIYKAIANILYPFADGIVFQTKSAQEYFPAKVQRKSRIIMNQVVSSFFLTEHLSEDYYVATGRLNPQKNYFLMIDAFDKLVKQYPESELRIYGEGELRERLQKYIEELSLEKNIKLMGRSDNISEVLSHAKCFLLSSDFEGMPNGLLEALAVGVPCIATDCPCGGPSTVIENGVNGILTPVKNTEKFYEALQEIEDSPDRRKALSKIAKQKAEEFSPTKVFEEWGAFIEQIITI